jgi:protein-S-isoprenylcysteine O-methyltransferase Ste14
MSTGPSLWLRLSRQVESPPVWTLLFLALIALLSRFAPVWPPTPVLRMLGLCILLLAAAVLLAAVWEFRRAETTILPREAPRALITGGIYQLSRNPIYLADVLFVTGCALRWELAGLALAPLLGLILQQRFILGEEAGCRAAFGPAFEAYAARVRRWL